jgi:hypothetical protein
VISSCSNQFQQWRSAEVGEGRRRSAKVGEGRRRSARVGEGRRRAVCVSVLDGASRSFTADADEWIVGLMDVSALHAARWESFTGGFSRNTVTTRINIGDCDEAAVTKPLQSRNASVTRMRSVECGVRNFGGGLRVECSQDSG